MPISAAVVEFRPTPIDLDLAVASDIAIVRPSNLRKSSGGRCRQAAT
jgi:hypothetical protein